MQIKIVLFGVRFQIVLLKDFLSKHFVGKGKTIEDNTLLNRKPQVWNQPRKMKLFNQCILWKNQA